MTKTFATLTFMALIATPAAACEIAGKWQRAGGNGVDYRYVIDAGCTSIDVSADGKAFQTYPLRSFKNGWEYRSQGTTVTFRADRSVKIKRKNWSGSGGVLQPAQF